jgi:hypothetical protein
MIKYIIQYWQQLLLVFSAIGFVIAKFFEVALKRKELIFNLYHKEKIDLILKFHKSYAEFKELADKDMVQLKRKWPVFLKEELQEKLLTLVNYKISFILLTDNASVSLCENIYKLTRDHYQIIASFYQKEVKPTERDQEELSTRCNEIKVKIFELFETLGKQIRG